MSQQGATGPKQVGPNRIELLFDRPVNLQSATRAGSYWVRNNLDRPADIASIGKNDPVNRETALTPNRVVITTVERTGTRFLMTFNVNATQRRAIHYHSLFHHNAGPKRLQWGQLFASQPEYIYCKELLKVTRIDMAEPCKVKAPWLFSVSSRIQVPAYVPDDLQGSDYISVR